MGTADSLTCVGYIVTAPQYIVTSIVLGNSEVLEASLCPVAGYPGCGCRLFVYEWHGDIVHVDTAPPAGSHYPFTKCSTVTVVNVVLGPGSPNPVVVATTVGEATDE